MRRVTHRVLKRTFHTGLPLRGATSDLIVGYGTKIPEIHRKQITSNNNHQITGIRDYSDETDMPIPLFSVTDENDSVFHENNLLIFNPGAFTAYATISSLGHFPPMYDGPHNKTCFGKRYNNPDRALHYITYFKKLSNISEEAERSKLMKFLEEKGVDKTTYLSNLGFYVCAFIH